jgi:DNA-binding transcriptional MocR family regulator
VRLPPGGDAERLLKASLEVERISFVPGSAFSPGGGADASHCLRLNFSNPSPDQIRDGIRRLATLL